MKKLEGNILDVYKNRILNIHPALLPKYGGEGMYGINVHRAVLRSDDKESGATIHLVNEEYDSGKILSQYRIPRYKTDTVETLSERVLEVEKIMFPRVLKDITKGVIQLF